MEASVNKKQTNTKKTTRESLYKKKLGLQNSALRIAKNKGWRSVSISEVAKDSKLPLGEAIKIYPTTTHLLAGIFESINVEIINSLDSDPLEGRTVRESLFDIMMRRFDIFNTNREAMVSIITEINRDPIIAATQGKRLFFTMSWILEAVGDTSFGLIKALKIKGLIFIYICTLKTWLKDDKPEMEGTMAALDRALADAEKLCAFYDEITLNSAPLKAEKND